MGSEHLQLLLTGGIFFIGFLSLIFASFYLIISPLKEKQEQLEKDMKEGHKKLNDKMDLLLAQNGKSPQQA